MTIHPARRRARSRRCAKLANGAGAKRPRHTIARIPYLLYALSLLLLLFAGCSRAFWRKQADRDSYRLLNQKRSDPRWAVPRIDVRADPRSRFFDPYCQDKGPLPPDDPFAARDMLRVAGKRGYKSWHKFGRSLSIENPDWLKPFGVTPEVIQQAGHNGEPSSVKGPELNDVTLAQAVELANIHNRDYQTQIENAYLQALALTFERFQFGVRYLNVGGQEPSINATHNSTPHGANNQSLNSSIGVSQLLPSGAQLAVELANNTLWMFSGPDSVNTASILSYSIVQPLLFQAGRKIALENLTQAERNVLYSVRTLARFRKILFTNIVSGNGGYLNVLQQAQLAENQRANIRRVLEQLEFLDALASRVIVTYYEDLAALPANDVRLSDMIPLQSRYPTVARQLNYDTEKKQLSWRGVMSREQSQVLLKMSANPAWEKAIRGLIRRRIYEPLAALPAGVKFPPLLADQAEYSGDDKRLYWRGPMSERQAEQLVGLSRDPSWQVAAAALVSRLRAETRTNQVLQLQSRLVNSQNSLRAAERRYNDTVDSFKVLLGLPPNMKLSIDTQMLRQFELIAPQLFSMEDAVKNYVEEWARLDEADADEAKLKLVIDGLINLQRNVETKVLGLLQSDLARVKKFLPERLRRLESAIDQGRVRRDLARDEKLLQSLRADMGAVKQELSFLAKDFAAKDQKALTRRRSAFGAGLGAGMGRVAYNDQKRTAVRAIADLREQLLQIVRDAQVIQIGLRVELITIQPFTMSIDDAIKHALQQRLDLKNARAIVMDARRRVEVAANRLQAVLNIRAEGNINTRQGTKPFDFRGRQSNFRVGIGFTAPLDLVNERNQYRSAIIDYQRARRDYINLEDQIKLSVRTSWRRLDQLRQNFNTAQQAIRIAAQEFDSAVASTLQPGQGGGGNSGLTLLNALNSVLSSQDQLISIWVDYEQSRLNIHRDMGIMEIDSRGLWNDSYYQRGTTGDKAGPPKTLPNIPLAPPPSARRSDHEPDNATKVQLAAGSVRPRQPDPVKPGERRSQQRNRATRNPAGKQRRLGTEKADRGRPGPARPRRSLFRLPFSSGDGLRRLFGHDKPGPGRSQKRPLRRIGD